MQDIWIEVGNKGYLKVIFIEMKMIILAVNEEKQNSTEDYPLREVKFLCMKRLGKWFSGSQDYSNNAAVSLRKMSSVSSYPA